MKVAFLALALCSVAVGWIESADKKAPEVLVVIGGDVHGYLSPCGCTKPMTGGIKRRATAVRNLVAGKKALVLENGGLIGGIGRQDEIKAEAMAEALKSMGVDAVNLTSSDAALGRGPLESLARLSGGKLTSATLANERGLPIKQIVEADGFLVGGLSASGERLAQGLQDQSVSLADAGEALALRAKARKLPLVIMLEGSESDARSLASAVPTAKLIVYSATGDAPSGPIHVGDQLLVTPGEHGKALLRMKYRAGKFADYAVVKLSPEFGDDPRVEAIYDTYLSRVTSEKLLEALPRSKGPKFAGNPTCGTCHTDAMLAWEKSRHAGALHTLEIEKHGRDPDCVRCHVVGLDNENGYLSRKLTPHLTDVGCESCHGAGGDHALNPVKFPMAKVGEASCNACHTREQSPNFDFAAYWAKVKH